MAKKVTVIEPTITNETIEETKLKVCAYCRVSSMNEDQQNSFVAQTSYYTEYITSNPNWTFVEIYADEGISGTTKEKRLDFLRMIDDCELGLIDFVVTKSISRFARNTADCIEVVRRLKELGVGILFEKENINTLSQESELVLSVLSSIAQEESCSISTNITWSNQKRFSRGIVPRIANILGYGYDKETKQIIINEEEAQLIRQMFSWYIGGMGDNQITMKLNELNIPAMKGGKWAQCSVSNILKNPRYCGDVLLQKTIRRGTLGSKRKKNDGELPKYYVKNNHPPIISREDFELAQEIRQMRRLKHGLTEEVIKNRANRYPLSGKVICGVCNEKFNHCFVQTTNKKSRKKYNRGGWHCRYDRKEHCGNRTVWDITIEGLVIQVFNKLWSNKEAVLVPYRDTLKQLYRTTKGEDIHQINEKINELTNQMRTIAQIAANGSLSPVLYNSQSAKITNELELYKKKRLQATQIVVKNNQMLKSTEQIIDKLKETDHAINTLDEDVIDVLIKEIIVFPENTFHVVLQNGMHLIEEFGGERHGSW